VLIYYYELSKCLDHAQSNNYCLLACIVSVACCPLGVCDCAGCEHVVPNALDYPVFSWTHFDINFSAYFRQNEEHLLTVRENQCIIDISLHNEEWYLMAETTNLNIRIDKALKERAETVFGEMGMNMTTAFNIFVRQTLRQGKIPFEIYTDPFYCDSNMRVLRQSIRDANNGKLTEHDLIED